MAALKAQAAMEPDVDEEPALPTITEADEGLEGTLSGVAAAQAAAFVSAQHQQAQGQQGQQQGSEGGGMTTSGSFNSSTVFGGWPGVYCVMARQLKGTRCGGVYCREGVVRCVAQDPAQPPPCLTPCLVVVVVVVLPAPQPPCKGSSRCWALAAAAPFSPWHRSPSRSLRVSQHLTGMGWLWRVKGGL